jgi:diguanylate cyclase (GGDEF)-like protein
MFLHMGRAYPSCPAGLIEAGATADIPTVRLFERVRRLHADPRAEISVDQAELAALHETTLTLLDRQNPEDLLETIVERAGALLGTRHGYLYLLEPSGTDLRVHVGTGIFRDLVNHRLRVGKGAQTGEPLVVDDYSNWADAQPELQALSFRAVIGVPLSGGGQVIGVIGLAHLEPDRTFGASEIDLLTRFGQLASIALENARLYSAAQDELRQRRNAEEELLDTVARLRRSEEERQRAQEETIRRLGQAAEFRDSETGGHVERMSRYCALLGRGLGLDEERCELLRVASPLHDIGKIGISDEILLKPGPLTKRERTDMERHAELGYRLLAGSQSELLELAAVIAWTHHERFDGRGYPRGLAGEEIPLAGRIASVADVFDALTSDRIYRPAFGLDETVDLMRLGRGTQFDPIVLDAFLGSMPEVEAIAAARGNLESVPGHVAGVRMDGVDAFEIERTAPGADTVEALDSERLRAACANAETALDAGGHGRTAIDSAFSALTSRFEGKLLVSTYILEHGILWLIAQAGYREVRDGIQLDKGVMARSVRTNTTQFVPSVAGDPDFIEATGGIVSEVALPFGGDGSVPATGSLNIETVGASLPAEAETIFAPLARRLGERIEEMRDGLGLDVAALARLCVYASTLRGVDAISEFAARVVGRLLDLDCVQVDLRADGGAYTLASFWRRENSQLEPLAASDLQRLSRIEEESGSGAAYLVLDQRNAPLQHADRSTPWLAWFPLRIAGAEIGAVVGRAKVPPAYDHDHLEAAKLFVQHAGALIDVALALRREQRAAVTDALTGLLNRRGFDERLREELERAAHAGVSVALVMVDCDGLKTTNDTGGHELGDRVLQSIARCLRTNKRLEDVAARLGGDEFAVLIPGADGETGARIAERFRKELNRTPLGLEHPIAATFGVASFPADGSTAADLLRAADRALYLAKERGGNQTLALTA